MNNEIEKMEFKSIKSQELHEGMRFSAPLFFDDGENMFLPENTPILAVHLQILEYWHIPYVLTCGSELGESEDALIATLSDEFELMG